MAYSYASEAGTVGVVSETLSLALIVVSFMVVTYVALKVRKWKSFQFEIFFFTLVLVAAEIPRTLYSLGVLDIDALSPIGLEIHSASMVVLAGLVAYRTVGFFRGRPMVAMQGGSDESIVNSALNSVSKTLGEATARTLNFYVDPVLLVTNPTAYSRLLRGLLGDGAGMVEESVISGICEVAMIQRSTVSSVEEAVRQARTKSA